MDESSDRAMALNLKIRISGTLGILLKSKRDGEISSLNTHSLESVNPTAKSSLTSSTSGPSPARIAAVQRANAEQVVLPGPATKIPAQKQEMILGRKRP